MLINIKHLFVIVLLTPIFLAGCGSSNNSTATPVPDDISFAVILSSEFTVPQTVASGSGTASLTLDRDSGALSGSVMLMGLSGSITAAHIHNGIAGITGAVLVTLQPDASNTSLLTVPTGTTLDATQIVEIQNSEYYINVHTAANPSGELRGQIVAANQQIIRTLLKGENEVPLAVNSVNSATAYITVDTISGEVRGNIRNMGLADASAVHIHMGFAGINGAVQTTLIRDAGDVALWATPDNTLLDASQLASLLVGGLYFNVHTPTHPGGEVRGQIIAPPIELVRVSLSGDFEVPAAVMSAGSAVGYVTVDGDSGMVTANIITDALVDSTAAHIHRGLAGTNGNVIVTLTRDASDTRLFSSAAGEVLDAVALAEFFDAKLYLNVHTASNPAGEVRAQLAPANTAVIRSVLDGSQEVPAIITAASGVAYTTVNENDGSINANLRTHDLTTVAAHIHEAVAGTNGGVLLGLINDASDTDFWSVSGVLSTAQLMTLMADGLYFNAHSALNPGGEIRAQIIHE